MTQYDDSLAGYVSICGHHLVLIVIKTLLQGFLSHTLETAPKLEGVCSDKTRMSEDEGFDKVELDEKDKKKEKKDGEKEEVGKIIFETETFSSMAWRKCKHFFTNITLEPVMLFYGIVGWVGLQ